MLIYWVSASYYAESFYSAMVSDQYKISLEEKYYMISSSHRSLVKSNRISILSYNFSES
jgi:hypothetical protein